jgi:hypothetical protein
MKWLEYIPLLISILAQMAGLKHTPVGGTAMTPPIRTKVPGGAYWEITLAGKRLE